MKPFRSLRWRFQLWYGLLLTTVLAGFAITAYGLQRAQRLRRIDDELRQQLSALMARSGPPGRPGPRGPLEDRFRGPRDEGFRGPRDEGRRGPREDGFRGPRDEGPRRGPPDPPPPDGPPGEPGRPRGPLADGGPRRGLLEAVQELPAFDSGARNSFYALVFLRNGPPRTVSPGAPADIPLPAERESGLRQRGTLREAFLFPGPGDCVLVGRDIGAELAELRRFGWMLAGAGVVVLAAGALGGWLLAGSALRPIGEISAAATKISGGNLAERIPVAGTESELTELAGVLNSTFSRLESAFAQQARFSSDAAHELRTPVAVILTQAQSILARPRPAEEYKEALEACQRAAERMRRLIESLLALARAEAGHAQPAHALCDLATVSQECLDLLRPLAEAHGVTLQADFATALTRGDCGQLGQVATNLLTNAIQHTPTGGTVTARTRVEGGRAELIVEDTGSGIAPEDLPHIFERFYRADKSRTGSSRTGLGLAIVRAIVEGHGGEVQPEPCATGARFVVRLPAEPGTPALSAPGFDREAVAASGRVGEL